MRGVGVGGGGGIGCIRRAEYPEQWQRGGGAGWGGGMRMGNRE